MDETTYRTCPLCEATCGLEITTVDGRITRIRGDREDVFSHGFICPKGSTLRQLHEDPDRVRTPLVKVDGEFVPATWEEAFTRVAEGLGEVWADGDRDAVAVYLGNPTVHSLAGTIMAAPLIKAFGTKNLYSASTVDQMPKHVSAGLMFGSAALIPVPDLDRTDYLLMLGANPLASNGSLCTAPDFPGRLAAIRARGGRVVTVDPRRTRTAEASDEHVAIRPGTDALWLAALVTEVSKLGRIDYGSIAGFTDGLDDALAALEPFTPASVAAHTRVDADTTRRIAEEFATAPSAAAYGRIGTHTTTFGTLASWCVDLLNAVTGNLDRPGGAMFSQPATSPPTADRSPGGRGFTTGRWTSRVNQCPEVRGELPVAELATEIETEGPGRIRALVTNAGNPARSCPNSERLDAALAGLDFMVSVDIYVNETTRHADVILPSPSPLAKAQHDLAFYGLAVRNVANYSPPMHGPDDPSEPGMAEHDILAKLALIAGGMGPDADPGIIHSLVLNTVAQQRGVELDEIGIDDGAGPLEQILDLMLRTGSYDLTLADLLDAPHGVDLGALTPQLPGALRTPNGRVDLAPASIIADVDRLAAELRRPADDRLLLVGRRHLRSNNSWMHNIDVLVKGKPRCTLQVHPTDAATHGLTDGGFAAVSTEAGRVEAAVEVTDDVAAGTVSLPHGWGHDTPGVVASVAVAVDGVNSNALTPDTTTDPLSGNAQLNAIPVELAPVGT